MKHSRYKNMTGEKHGKWTVLSYHGQTTKSGNYEFLCECECGTQAVVQGSKLRNGKSRQCKRCHGRNQMQSLKYRKGYSEADDLYMIQCGPYVKIGITNNIDVRLRSLQSSNPYPLKLIGLWKGEAWREKLWHDSLAHCHVTGEWYKLGGACEI